MSLSILQAPRAYTVYYSSTQSRMDIVRMCYPDRPVKISYWANLTYSLTEAYVSRVTSRANLSHLKSHQPLNPSRLPEKQSFVNDSSHQTIKADRKDNFIKTTTVFREIIYLRRPSQHRATREMRLIISRSSQSGIYCFLRTSLCWISKCKRDYFKGRGKHLWLGD